MFEGMKNVWSGITDYVGTNSSASKTPIIKKKSKRMTGGDYDDQTDFMTPKPSKRSAKFQTVSKAKEKVCIKRAEFIKMNDLPPNFAENVMDLEMKIEEGNFSISDIDSLVYLYSQGIEFYEGKDENKHANFYKRTQRLLNKPSVFEAMKKK